MTLEFQPWSPKSFGPVLLPDGGVRFRLWAPSVEDVSLVLYDEEANERDDPDPRHQLPMEAVEREVGGERHRIYEATVPEAEVGTRYGFRLPGGLVVPDPASRYQPQGVHGPSEVVAPEAYAFRCAEWRGRPWAEAVVYELHVGTFTREGTFAAATKKLPYLAELGITAVELMPVSSFPGARNWGYDGVLPYAPSQRYGRPEALKAFVDRAHELGLMVLLDVVYNHFGPDGNYLYVYAKEFFTSRHETPWGDAIHFCGQGSGPVRRFFVENARYWIQEFRFDGLRLDAVHAIFDSGEPHILEELAGEVRQAVEQEARSQEAGSQEAASPAASRHVTLVLENDDNAAKFLGHVETAEGTGGAESSALYDAQWNDDAHHVYHHLLTGEEGGYYRDYVKRPHHKLAQALGQGFVYTGQPSPFRGGLRRGEPSGHLNPAEFVDFLQNHDQVGNRAMGERIHELSPQEALAAATAVLLLSPSVPLLFMGQEWGSRQPFPFFCDLGGELAEAVTQGRRREFAAFPRFQDPKARDEIPDPNALSTYEAAKLRWEDKDTEEGRWWHRFHQRLLALRQERIVPLVRRMDGGASGFEAQGTVVWAAWEVSGEAGEPGFQRLELLCNLSSRVGSWRPREEGLERDTERDWIYGSPGEVFAAPEKSEAEPDERGVAPWTVGVWIHRGRGRKGQGD